MQYFVSQKTFSTQEGLTGRQLHQSRGWPGCMFVKPALQSLPQFVLLQSASCRLLVCRLARLWPGIQLEELFSQQRLVSCSLDQSNVLHCGSLTSWIPKGWHVKLSCSSVCLITSNKVRSSDLLQRSSSTGTAACRSCADSSPHISSCPSHTCNLPLDTST